MTEPLTRESEWTTKDRKKVRVCDMDDHHLLNTINVLRKLSYTEWFGADPRRRQWLNVLANEAYLRGLYLKELQPEEFVHE